MSEAEIPAGYPSSDGGKTLIQVGDRMLAPRGYESVGFAGAYQKDLFRDNAPTIRTQILGWVKLFHKRKWLILGILGAALLIGTLRTLLQTPLYTATVRIQIDRNAAKVVEGGNILPSEGADFEFIRTQYELLQSRSIAERAVSALKLGDKDDFLKRSGFSLIGSIRKLFSNPPAETSKARETAAVEQVVYSRTIRPVTGSRLVDINYADPSPTRAYEVATALADGFIASNLDKRFEANAYAKTFLEDQANQLKLRVDQSEKALLAFADKQQIVVASEKGSIAETNLTAANAALTAIVTERIKAEQLWRQVADASEINLPQLLSNTVVEGLRVRRNALTTDYEEKLETFKANYPAMIELRNKIRETDRQLAVEVKTIKSSFKGSYEAALNQEEKMKEQIDALRKEMLDLQRRSLEYNTLKQEADTNRRLYTELLQRYKQVDIAGGVGANNIFIVDRAQVPVSPSSPILTTALLLSLALGLGAGVSAAFVMERFDDTLRAPDEVDEISGLPMLGIIPKADAETNVVDELSNPNSMIAEAYRSLGTALQFSTDSGLPRSLVVTSTGPSEGKSITSIAIARHFAVIGLKVLLIDADLRLPSLHKKLGLDASIGLTNYLTGGCTPPQAMQRTSVDNLLFMASGPLPPNATDLLASSRFASLLSVGGQVVDLIIIDGPPVMGLADALLLSGNAAATIYVVGAGSARSGSMRTALRRLQQGRVPLIGTVMTKFDAKSAGYGYGYGYGYGSGYGYFYGGTRTEAEAKQVGKAPAPIERQEPKASHA